MLTFFRCKRKNSLKFSIVITSVKPYMSIVILVTLTLFQGQWCFQKQTSHFLALNVFALLVNNKSFLF